MKKLPVLSKVSKTRVKEARLIKYISVFFIALVLACAFCLTANISLKYKKPVGDDFRFHLKAATLYSQGKNAFFDKEILAAFGGPYPPLFHLFLALLVKLGVAIQAAVFLQIIFYPLILLSAAFLVWKKKGVLAAAFAITLMFTSIALFDRAQVIPQSIDMILFPFAVFFFLEKRKVPFVVLMLIMIYSHGYFSLLLFAALALFSFAEKKNREFITATALLSLPLIAFSLPFIGEYIRLRFVESALMIREPLFILNYFGFLLAVFLPLALICCFIERKNLDELDRISVYWLFAALVLCFMFPDRMASYAVMPASIIISRMFKRFATIPRIGIFIAVLLLMQLFLSGFLLNFMRWWNVLQGIAGETFNVS